MSHLPPDASSSTHRRVILSGNFTASHSELRSQLAQVGIHAVDTRWTPEVDAVIAGMQPGRAASMAPEAGIVVLDASHLQRLLGGEAWTAVVPGSNPHVLRDLTRLLATPPNTRKWRTILNTLETSPLSLRDQAMELVEVAMKDWPRVILTGNFTASYAELRAQLAQVGIHAVYTRWTPEVDAVLAGVQPGEAASMAPEAGIVVLDVSHLKRLLDGEAWTAVVPGSNPHVLEDLTRLLATPPNPWKWKTILETIETGSLSLRDQAMDMVEVAMKDWPIYQRRYRAARSQVYHDLLGWIDDKCIQSWPVAFAASQPALGRLVRALSHTLELESEALPFLEQIPLEQVRRLQLGRQSPGRWLDPSRLESLASISLSDSFLNREHIPFLRALPRTGRLRKVHLSFGKYADLTISELRELSDALSEQPIEYLYLDIAYMSVEQFLAFASSLPPQISILQLNNPNFSGARREFDAFLERLDGLERLTVHRSLFEPRQSQKLLTAPSLRSLKTLTFSGKSKAGIAELAKNQPLQQLEYFSLCALSGFSLNPLQLAQAMPALVGLKLTGEFSTSRNLKALGSSSLMAQLKLLSFRANDVCLKHLSKSPPAPCLRTLHLNYGEFQSDNLEQLLESGFCPNLTEIFGVYPHNLSLRLNKMLEARGIRLELWAC